MKHLTKLVPLAAAAAILLYFGISAPDFYLIIAILMCYYILLGVGWNIVAGYTRLPSFAQAAFASLGGYVSGIFVYRTGAPVPFGMIVGILTIGVISLGIGYVTLKMSGSYLALATIGFSESVRISLYVNSTITGGGTGFFPKPLIPHGTDVEYYYLFIGITVLMIYFSYRLAKSNLGIIMKAVGDDEDAARAVGINVRLIRLIAFTLSGLLAALGGVLYAHYYLVIFPEDGSLGEMATIMIGPMAGGLGTLLGPVLGPMLMIGIREYIRTYVGPYDLLAFGMIMVIVMRFGRNGISGVVRSLSSRMRTWGRRKPPVAESASESARQEQDRSTPVTG